MFHHFPMYVFYIYPSNHSLITMYSHINDHISPYGLFRQGTRVVVGVISGPVMGQNPGTQAVPIQS